MTTTFRRRKYIKPRIDKAQAIVSGFIMGGLTLHIVNGAIDIQPSDQVTEAARRYVKEYEAILLAYLRGLPAEPTVDPGSRYGFTKLDELEF